MAEGALLRRETPVDQATTALRTDAAKDPVELSRSVVGRLPVRNRRQRLFRNVRIVESLVVAPELVVALSVQVLVGRLGAVKRGLLGVVDPLAQARQFSLHFLLSRHELGVDG